MNNTLVLPGENLNLARMPGHWVLAQMGKRVLRPGGIAMTKHMLSALEISKQDTVVELAPGLGATALLTLTRQPATYIAVERDPLAAARVRDLLQSPNHHCIVGNASETGLSDASADVVYGEAMLTMQTQSQKQAISAEVFRVLKSGGRYAIHELGLTPYDLCKSIEDTIAKDLAAAIHVGARPLTVLEWCDLLASTGFIVDLNTCSTKPMHLLELRRLIRDEGLVGAARIVWNVIKTPSARQRILNMRRVFRRHASHLCAITLVARKP